MKAISEKENERKKLQRLRMFKLDFFANKDYDIINGVKRNRPDDSTEVIQELKNSFFFNKS